MSQEEQQLTFANMPSDSDPEPEPAPPSPAPAAPPAPTPPAPTPPMPHAPQPDVMAVVRAQEDERARRERAEAEARERREMVSKMYEPPAPPSNIDDLTADGKHIVDYVESTKRWAAETVRRTAGLLVEEFDRRLRETEQRATEPALQLHATLAEFQAVQNLEAAGIQNARELMSEVEQIFRANPDNYHALRTNPESIEWAARYVANQRGILPAAPAPGDPPRTTVAAPPSPGYYPGTPGSRSRSVDGPLSEAVRQSERSFGVKFGPAEMAELEEALGGRR